MVNFGRNTGQFSAETTDYFKKIKKSGLLIISGSEVQVERTK
jgi:hypothetical protein